ncbi:MAG: CAP domain-containing protein [Gemmatimonadota bacterium]|nr:CAP domain-containing protein [Gemmatimonadota bacterium]
MNTKLLLVLPFAGVIWHGSIFHYVAFPGNSFPSYIAVIVSEERVDSSFDEQLEEAIVQEHNLARQNPDRYATIAGELLALFDGDVIRRDGEPGLITREGPSAVREAVDFLRDAEPIGPLTRSRGMSLGARDLVKDHGPKGMTGHQGSDGSRPADRLERFGDWRRTMGENVAYGRYESNHARRVVLSLIIDDGVAGRGHRTNIFNPDFSVIGVACGPHERYGTMCVMEYAGGYIERY